VVEQAAVEGGLVLLGDRFHLVGDEFRDPRLLVGAGQVQPVHGAALHRLLAAAAAEDEVDRGEHLLLVQALDHPGQTVGIEVAASGLEAPPRPGAAVEAMIGGHLVLCLVQGCRDDFALFVEQGMEAVFHRQPQPQLGGTLGHRDNAHLAAVGLHPVGDLLIVGDRCRQAHEMDLGRRLGS